MKNVIYIFLTSLLLCACGTKQTQQQCPYQEDSFVIHGSVLKNLDSMKYYSEQAEQGDARAQYIMASSFFLHDSVTQMADSVVYVDNLGEALELLKASAAQGYKPAEKSLECILRTAED